jgi:hypothetical protein
MERIKNDDIEGSSSRAGCYGRLFRGVCEAQLHHRILPSLDQCGPTGAGRPLPRHTPPPPLKPEAKRASMLTSTGLQDRRHAGRHVPRHRHARFDAGSGWLPDGNHPAPEQITIICEAHNERGASTSVTATRLEADRIPGRNAIPPAAGKAMCWWWRPTTSSTRVDQRNTSHSDGEDRRRYYIDGKDDQCRILVAEMT